MIVAGTAVVSLSKKKGAGAASSALGFAFIASSLVFDGVTGGIQKRVKTATAARGIKPKPYDYMFWTNAYMLATAAAFALTRGEVSRGLAFCLENPEIWAKILRFGACSAIGQSFIFFTIAHFDPLVCTTVTTTRKIFSVLLSIVLKGHSLNLQGWSGVCLASAGIRRDEQAERRTPTAAACTASIAAAGSSTKKRPSQSRSSSSPSPSSKVGLKGTRAGGLGASCGSKKNASSAGAAPHQVATRSVGRRHPARAFSRSRATAAARKAGGRTGSAPPRSAPSTART
ncbi:UDP-galactose transmembrane transporter [Aureococcus anophagefferens]|nr:UDP-galactose transmembrane transporter [Aureococcus anophagefferens]